MDGILNINKPEGMTSFSVVAVVRHLSGERRVGHAVTLDPAATGVLPVCLGQGTRVVEFMGDADKTYRAEIELGVTTDTYDTSGQITEKRDPSGISLAQVEAALSTFCGMVQQTPPMYSALKFHGRPLYKLAREGITITRKSRLVKIEKLVVLDWQPPSVVIEMVCGKGTYVRSLAHDLGQVLGCGASLKALARLRYGPFDIVDAVSVPELEDGFRYGYWQHFMHPIDSVLLNWDAVLVGDSSREGVRNGRLQTLGNAGKDEGDVPVQYSENRCRAYDLDGQFLGVLRFNAVTGEWQPEKVFARGLTEKPVFCCQKGE